MDTYWMPDWDLIGWHTLYVQARNAEGRWSTSGSYELLVDPTWGYSTSGGTLTLGDVEDLNLQADEKPIHSTTLSGFWISSYEVTQQFYLAVMGNNPSWHTSANGYSDDLTKPVENVSFQDAIAFCNALSDAYGYTRAYTIIGNTVTWDPYANGFRLPTEAEWEFAARGGTDSLGYGYSGSDNPGEVAWFGDPSTGETHPVGSLYSNEMSLYDMTGNVWEWCWDNYSSTWYTDNPDWTDPRGPLYTDAYIDSSYQYVVRGGGYTNAADFVRNAYRGLNYDNENYPDLGFRVVTTW
jgi:formylglycine-generating enzyme required for sulfatase activity